MNDENPKVKAGVDPELETAANRMLRDAAASADNPVEWVFAHGCGLIGPCQCKQWIPITEAENKVRLGEADWLSDLIRGMPHPPQLPNEKMYRAIVFRRGTRSPRATVTGAAHITHLTHFKNEEAQRRELFRRVTTPENERLVRVIETWPEYKELNFEDDEYIIWVNIKPFLIVDTGLFDEVAHEFVKSADEIKNLFDRAEGKIQKHHCGLIKHKTGIYASWKNMPTDFGLVPAGRMLRTLNVMKRLLSIPEFKRLSGDQQTAIRAYVDTRLNYRSASKRAKIPENTIRDRVQRGFATLGKIRAQGNLSAEFRAIQKDLFGADIKSLIESAEARERALEDKSIAATGGEDGYDN